MTEDVGGEVKAGSVGAINISYQCGLDIRHLMFFSRFFGLLQ